MKKYSFIMLMAAALFASCSSCSDKHSQTLQKSELTVENTISSDREYMYTLYNDNYKWYETIVTLDEYVDAEDCDGSVEEVSNIFRYFDEQTGDIKTATITHTRDTVLYDTSSEIVIGFHTISDEAVRLTYNGAFQRLAESNTVRPHTRTCILVMSNNPNSDNAQYIFSTDTIYVSIDAISGTVTTEVFEISDED